MDIQKQVVPPPPAKVKLVSKFPEYIMVIEADQSSEKPDENGRIRRFTERPGKVLEFEKNCAEVPAELLPQLKANPMFGVDFWVREDLLAKMKANKVWAAKLRREMERRRADSDKVAYKDAMDFAGIIEDPRPGRLSSFR